MCHPLSPCTIKLAYEEWGERRCQPSDNHWDEDEHCPNTALFAQVYLALLAENASIRVSSNGWGADIHRKGNMVFTQDFPWNTPVSYVRLLASNTKDIDYIGLSIAQHTWRF